MAVVVVFPEVMLAKTEVVELEVQAVAVVELEVMAVALEVVAVKVVESV